MAGRIAQRFVGVHDYNENPEKTPFNLTYGTEAVILVEVRITNLRREVFYEGSNDDQLRVNLDCLDEFRGEASHKMTKYQ